MNRPTAPHSTTPHRISGAAILRVAAAALLVTAGAAAAPPTQFVEEFTSTTYKDAANTTADWDTVGGRLRLLPFAPSILGTYDTPGTAYGATVVGSLVFVADYGNGLAILDVSDPASPTLVGAYDTPGWARGVAVAGDRAYVADSDAGLQIIDVSDPASPVWLGAYDTPGTAVNVALSGTRAYVADLGGDLRIVDVGNPASPTLLGFCSIPGTAYDVEVAGDLAYVAAGLYGLQIVDVGNPASPVVVGSYDTVDYAQGIAVSGTRVYLATYTEGLKIIDVGNPASPVLLSTFSAPPNEARDVMVSGTTVCLANEYWGLQVIDVSDPAGPALVANCDTPGIPYGVAVAGTRAFVADGASGLQVIEVAAPATLAPLGDVEFAAGYAVYGVAVSGATAYACNFNGLRVVDVSDPANPMPLGMYDTPGIAVGTAVSGTTAYVAADAAGLVIVDVTDPASPVLLGAYDTPSHAYDVAVAGATAYVADGTTGLVIVNAANPASPSLLGAYDTPGDASAVAVSGTTCYVADGATGLVILDVGNAASPVLLGTYDTPSFAHDVAVSGARAYVADHTAGLRIIDVADPASPSLLGAYDTPGDASAVAVSGTLVCLADGANGVILIDASDPTEPTPIGRCDTPGTAVAVTVAGDVAYIGDGDSWTLRLVEVLQRRFVDPSLDQGASLPLDESSDPIVRARLASTQVESVHWTLSADGGLHWRSASPGGGWLQFSDPGADLLWRSQLIPAGPVMWSAAPEASRLQIDWLYEFPIVTSVADVPDDQGGRVRLSFLRSGYDFGDEATHPVTGYQVWHRVAAPALAGGVLTQGVDADAQSGDGAPPPCRLGGRTFTQGGAATAGSLPPGTWEAVAWVAATQSDSYTTLVPTTADSTSEGMAWSVYVVTAHTTTPAYWYASYADSGCSLDNLAPSVPTGLLASHEAEGNLLTWDAAADEDFRYFKVYRSGDPGFVPGPENLAHTTIETSWTDADAGTAYYKLAAVDFAGNESAPASASVVVGVEGPVAPSRFALAPPAPNPSRDVTLLRYDVPAVGGDVRVAVHDVHGRLVRVLADGAAAPGRHAVEWDGRDEAGRALAPGLYLVRMRAPGFDGVRRVVRVR